MGQISKEWLFRKININSQFVIEIENITQKSLSVQKGALF